MSIRLQVLLAEEELAEYRAMANKEQIPLSEWVRRALRNERDRRPGRTRRRKHEALQAAMQHDFPTADIDQMLSEIARGRNTELPS